MKVASVFVISIALYFIINIDFIRYDVYTKYRIHSLNCNIYSQFINILFRNGEFHGFYISKRSSFKV